MLSGVRTAVRRVADAPYAMMAWMTCVALTAGATPAAAQQGGGIGGMAGRIADTFNNVGAVVLGALFIGGVGLTGSGLMKLKEASEHGGHGQVKYSDAIWRLAAGVGLAGVPSVIALTGQTLFGGDTNSPLQAGTIRARPGN